MNARTTRLGLAALFLLSTAAGSPVFATELRLGRAMVPPGAVVSVPVTFAGTSAVMAAQADVIFDSSRVSLAGVSVSNSPAGHIVDQQELVPGRWRVLIYSVTNGSMAPGALAWLHFNIPTNAPDGVVPLLMANAVVALTPGNRVQPLAQVDGALTVSSAANITSVVLGNAGLLRIMITGLAGQPFTLQGSPDLFHWADLGRYTNQSGTLVLTNGLPAGRDAYFYRTAVRPGTNSPALLRPTLSDARLLPDGRVRFELDATAGSVWRVQGSPDLTHWGDYGMVTNQSGIMPITNAPLARPSVYFHRVVQP